MAVALGQGGGGLFTIPTAAGLSGANASKVSALLSALQASGATAGTLSSALASGGAVASAITAAGGAVPTAASAQANITQGINGSSLVGTVWSGTCPACSSGAGGTMTLYFNIDGAVFGFGTISPTGAGRLIGTWQAGTGSPSSASFVLVTGTKYSQGPGTPTTLDGSYLAGTLSATSGTAQIYDATGTAQGASFTLSPVAPAAAGTSTAYDGAYQVSLSTVSAAGRAVGAVAGSSAIILAEAGGGANATGSDVASATFDPATGIGTITVNNTEEPTTCGGARPAETQTISFDLANGTLSNSVAGATVQGGTITRLTHAQEVLSNFSDNANTVDEAAAEQVIPLTLAATISWPANLGTATSSLVLGIAVTGNDLAGTACNPGPALAKLVAYGLRPELNPLGSGAAAATVADSFSLGYVQGQAQSYAVTVLGPAAQFCSVVSGAGAPIVDASSGNASAYPTISVVCTQ